MNIREQLLRDEGLRLKVYHDPSGKLTIGVGRNLEDRGVTHVEAMYLLDNDIRSFMHDICEEFPWVNGLDQARIGVLINMAFNMGVGGLKTFQKMLAALRVYDYDTAADELLNSEYVKQVGDRAQRLAKQLRTGEWQ